MVFRTSSTLFTFLLLLSLSAFAQETDQAVVEKIANGIIKETTFGIKNKRTGEIVYDFSTAPKELHYANPYNEWRYWNGVLGLAMQKLSHFTGDAKYTEYAKKNIQFAFDNKPIFKKMTDAVQLKGMEQFYKHELLDDCGAMAADLVEIYKIDKRADYNTYLQKTADYILTKEHRLADGTLARTWPHNKTVWLDDVYMSVPFLAKYGKLTNEKKYYDFAANQVQLFTKHLYNKETGLFFHCYYSGIEQNGPAYWGRANGWSILAQTELLAVLPKDHPARPELLRLYKQQIAGFSKYQSQSGLWHQLLNKEDSFLETSSTAMFVYAVAFGINNGWLNDIYSDLALSGWTGIKTMITPEGKVKNISKGTGTNTSLKYYYERPTPLNDIHGLGPVIMAGVEVIKLKKQLAK